MAQNETTLYFLTYNNYYNRIVKYEDNLTAYTEYQVEGYPPIVCNFDPADGIQTSHVLKLSNYIPDTPEVDYVVATAADANGDEKIISRWFIMDAERKSATQWTLSLQRDLVVDFYETVINTPVYIERAICSTGNNFIFNSDNLTVNQIKKQETILKDKTGCPWIVGYVASDLAEDKVIDASSDNIAKPVVSDYTYAEWQNFQAKGILKIDSVSIRIIGKNNIGGGVFQFVIGSRQEYKRLGPDADYPEIDIFFRNTKVGTKDGPLTLSELQALIQNNEAAIGQDIFDECVEYNYTPVLKQAEINAGLSTSGVLVKDENNTFFTATLSPSGHTAHTIGIKSGALYNRLIGLMYDNNIIVQNLAGLKTISITVTYTTYKATVKAYNGYVASTLIKSSKVAQLQDAPYKMFCIPYPLDEGTGKIRTTGGVVSPNAAIGMNMAMRIVFDLTKDNVYDLQLLPYCPATNFIDDDGVIDVSGITGQEVDKYYSPILSNDNLVSYMLWCDQSSFSINIPNPIAVPANNIAFKVEHETSFYRLNSPNYNGSFQFKATANRGVDYFEVDATYKPYTPYIHIAPNFKGLYGGDYNDARGLVCGGDFSLPTLTDAWETYQIQNKNYLNTFNRQVENMETTYDLQMAQYKQASGIGVLSSALTMGASGAYTGFTMGGGGMGAAIGGVVGTATGAITSAIGRKQDIAYSKALQAEAMSYTKDQFNLSLQNIQALPYTLNNVSAFNINNKYFPFLEYFTCSDEEKEAYRLKLIYRSMPIGAIGKITDYLQAEPTFISGQVIRFNELADDYHVAASLASELHQGIYI